MAQRARVIDLYKSLLRCCNKYALDNDEIRKKIKQAFLKNKDVTDPDAIEIHIVYGEYINKELEAILLLRKYTRLKREYLIKLRERRRTDYEKDK